MRSTRLAIVAFLCVSGLLSACGGGGGGSSSADTAPPPTAAIKSTGGATAGSTGSALQASVGSTIVLASASTAGQGASISSYQWKLSAEPSGSQVALTSASSSSTSFIPDLAGSYTLELIVTDSQGLTASQSVTVDVSSTPPVAVVVAKVVFSGPSVIKPPENIAVGSIVTFDASGSSDPDGEPVTISWLMVTQPANSSATLTTSGTAAHFSPDVSGQYQVRARATDPSGDYSDVTYVFEAVPPPTAVLVAQTSPPTSGATFSAYTGYQVVLDSTGSSVPTGDTLTRAWAFTSKPANSNTQLSAATGTFVNFIPDVAGTYVVGLTLTDTTTAAVTNYIATINVTVGPTAVVSGSSTPVPQITAPSFVSSPGVPVILRGSGSYEPGGAALTYAWTLVSRPSSSSAAIAAPSSQNITFTPDVVGPYVLELTVSDPQGNSSNLTATINVGSYPPVAIVAERQVSVLLGGTASVSAALSYDQAQLPLTYSWSIDARPAGSTATIASPTATTLAFTPDVVGTYTATVTVSNGTLDSVASVTIVAFSASAGTVPLSYLPLQVAYSKPTGKVVIVATNPNTLHIVDPAAATDASVPLPNGVKDLALSPDGSLAAVLHEGVVSLVDLRAATLLHSSGTGGSQTAVSVTNAGLVYLMGQTGGQWVTPGVTVLDGRTGNTVSIYGATGTAVFYGTVHNIYSDLNNKLFVISDGLSPSQIYSVSLDPTSGSVLGTQGSPYWGNYPMSAPFWLSGDQSLLFTAAGDYFSTANLNYVGTFNLQAPLLSMSHSSTAQEAVVLTGSAIGISYPTTYNYPAAYKRFTGSLLFPQADVPLPLVAGQQSYGIEIFHTNNDLHVMVVQTGTSQQNGIGAQYFVIER